MNDYKIPAKTRIGHVHLKVSDLQRSLDFYCGLLGFEKMVMYGDQAAFIAVGGYHHHIGLNTWQSKGGLRPHLNMLRAYFILPYYTRNVKTWQQYYNI